MALRKKFLYIADKVREKRGVRTDDVIVLEFESPVLPDELRVLRSPAAEKPKKGEGGGKEKGGKKKK